MLLTCPFERTAYATVPAEYTDPALYLNPADDPYPSYAYVPDPAYARVDLTGTASNPSPDPNL